MINSPGAEVVWLPEFTVACRSDPENLRCQGKIRRDTKNSPPANRKNFQIYYRDAGISVFAGAENFLTAPRFHAPKSDVFATPGDRRFRGNGNPPNPFG